MEEENINLNKNKFEIFNINPEPIGCFTLPLEKHLDYKKIIQSILENPPEDLIQEREHMKHTRQVCNTVNQNLFNSFPELKQLKSDIQQMLMEYIKSIGFVCDKFVINSAWLNSSQKGSVLNQHLHSNSYLSGNYFVNFDPLIHSTLTFQNDRSTGVTHYAPTLTLPLIEGVKTLYTSNFVSIPAVEGQIIIWRSQCRHGYFAPNLGDDRLTLSFNSMPEILSTGAYTFKVSE